MIQEYADVAEITHILEKSGLLPLSPLSRSHSWNEGAEGDTSATASDPAPTMASLTEEEVQGDDEKEKTETETKKEEQKAEEGADVDDKETTVKVEESEKKAADKEKSPKQGVPEPLELKKQRLDSLSSEDGNQYGWVLIWTLILCVTS